MGVLVGFLLIDFKVILFDGVYYDVDLNVMMFEIVVGVVFWEGIFQVGLKLFEFVMCVEIVILEEYMGDIMGDLSF